MNLDKYTELTGISVSDQEANIVKAQIRRSRIKLESMLGFTLDRRKQNENIYNEIGKSNKDCFCLGVSTSENLLPPDEVENSYRLFRFNKNDSFFFVDPFYSVNNVKLVRVRGRDEDGSGITIKTFDKDKIRAQVSRGGISKYIQRCLECMCDCNCSGDCVQLAVDASWIFQDCLPEDLMYVWADMITYYSDCKKDVKSESISGHSYTLRDKVAPEEERIALSIIQRYAGPYGSVSVVPV